MKTSSRTFLSVAAVAAIAIGFIASTGNINASFLSGDKQAVQTAIENQDYTIFSQIAPEKLTSVINTEEMFKKFVEVKSLRGSGDKDGAQVLSEELGFPQMKRRGKKGMRGFKGNEEVKVAMESGNYADLPAKAQEKITEEKFAEMIAKKAEKEAKRAEVEGYVSANNFDGFKSSVLAHMAEKESEDKYGKRVDFSEEELTEKLTERFTKMSEYYEENGELPEGKRRNFAGKRGK